MKKIYLGIIILSIFGLFVLSASAVMAQNTILIDTSNTTDCKKTCEGEANSEACKQYCGNYQLNDVMAIVIRVSQLILAVSGSLALLAFIYGGILFLTSRGNSSQVEKGKSVISGAVIGIIIVLTSWVIIGVVFQALGVQSAENFYKTNWFQG